MQLTLWTYEGPPHVGAMRVATAMRDVHYVLHAPQGDTYADLLFTMIERLPRRPPVTYTTFQARDLGQRVGERRFRVGREIEPVKAPLGVAVAEAVGAGEVDHADATVDQFAGERIRRLVGGRKESDLRRRLRPEQFGDLGAGEHGLDAVHRFGRAGVDRRDAAVRDVAAFRKLDPGPSGFLLNGVRDDVALAAQQFADSRLATVIAEEAGTAGSYVEVLRVLIRSVSLDGWVIIGCIVVLGTVAWWNGFSIFKLMRYLKEELLLVLGTSSSESALPRLMAKMENAGAQKSVVGLVVPTGYSFNLDGTSIYLTMAAVFIAQATNTPMDLSQQITLLVILLLTSKGAAGVTGSGFIVLAATLSAVGTVPVAGLALILGIDRFMSEARALTNFIGNSVATLVVAKWCKALDVERMNAVLNDETADEADNPELVLDDAPDIVIPHVPRPVVEHH